MITIWYELFCKLRVSFDGIVTSKELFLDSSHSIEEHIDVVLKVLEIQISVSFELCLDEDIIEYW